MQAVEYLPQLLAYIVYMPVVSIANKFPMSVRILFAAACMHPYHTHLHFHWLAWPLCLFVLAFVVLLVISWPSSTHNTFFICMCMTYL